MKRALIKGILSAAPVAACLVACGASPTPSQNVSDVRISATTNSRSYWPSTSQTVSGNIFFGTNSVNIYSSSKFWQKGPFTIGESRSWTNATRHINGPPPGDPAQIHTWFAVGTHSITVPLSPKYVVIIGATGLAILGLIIGGVLMKRRRVNADPRTG